MDVNKLIDELFPIKLYRPEYYPIKLTVSERVYLALYENANGDIDKVDTVMLEQVSKVTLNKIKSKLSESKLISLNNVKFTDYNDAKEFTIKNSHYGKICEWCGKESYILHRHHYPIPRNKGGTEIVNICPNCHYTFHKIIEVIGER